MKKIMSLILATVLLISLCAVLVGAENSADFAKDDAEKLLLNAYDLFNIYQDGSSADSDFVDGAYKGPWLICDENDVVEFVQVTSSGREYNCDAYRLLKVILSDKEYHVDTMEDVIKIAELYYVPSIAKLLTFACQNDEDRGLELIREADNGKLYFLRRGIQIWPLLRIFDFGKFTRSVDAATLEVYVKRYTAAHAVYFCKVGIEFTKTESGWRVSGGSLFDLMTENADYMDYCYKYIYTDVFGDEIEVILNPNTGDPTAIAIPALAVSALVSLAVPVGIVRKKRRA